MEKLSGAREDGDEEEAKKFKLKILSAPRVSHLAPDGMLKGGEAKIA
jgi:hypothetical protein